MTKVAVEEGLRPFQDALKSAGFVVVEIQSPQEVGNLHAHAVVVSGMDEDFLGMTDAGNAPVVSVAGRTPEEVVGDVRRSIGPRE